jgi:XRE family aerobic/anaerobic benzoate catabolism transcriptional regulator
VTRARNNNVPALEAMGEADSVLRNLAKRVRVLRAQRGMTRKQLAEQSGVSLPYLARVEGGVGNLSVSLLHKLALALNVSIETLVKEGELENGGDFVILTEFLKHQPADVLARLRRQLMIHAGAPTAVTRVRVALIGLRGAGKSTLGRLLADKLAVPFVELDKEIEKDAGTAIGEVITLYGQMGMRRLERSCIERIVDQFPRVVLATGGSIVSESGTYELLLREFFSVWLKARPEVHFTRVMNQNDTRIATPALQHEALEHIHRMLDARKSLYELAEAVVDTSDSTIEAAAQELADIINTNVLRQESQVACHPRRPIHRPASR